ncbi:DUF4317 domain-containing protein [Neobacillus sp. WH10]|uniref:DUF4317 domain-containing protein n=1 Tax=Neobacillus sp. WH10 TaxID=3047873 RepID=UPI0024C126CC|nr:DUF4317 domain-containing protein [Neobacillus sp. WH10]WHY75444.1 DUF4317 domain-containing protein [Neobacillus sp. WH10]
MNKKDIANIRKQFKLDNHLMNIREIFNVYVQKESAEIYHQVCQPFPLLDHEAQELFLANFKKVLTGHLDAKLFELKFMRDVDYSTQGILFEGLRADSEDWQDNMLDIVGKIFSHTIYEFDTVVTFIRGEYRKPTKKRNQESEEGGEDVVYSNEFILCSLNKTDLPKKSLMFDYIEKEFKSYHIVDPIINLDSPMSGFLFPTFNDNAADVNHILYCAGKVNQPDFTFIEKVLDCEDIMTAQDDKDCFDFILKEVIGDEVDSAVISNVYEEIDRVVQENQEKEDSEPSTLDHRDIERILTVSGVENVETAKVEHAFKSVVADEKHEFKASSLIPKNIKISTKVANVTINPKDLKNLKYITYEGKRCLLLEVDEEVVVEGFRLESKTL